MPSQPPKIKAHRGDEASSSCRHFLGSAFGSARFSDTEISGGVDGHARPKEKPANRPGLACSCRRTPQGACTGSRNQSRPADLSAQFHKVVTALGCVRQAQFLGGEFAQGNRTTLKTAHRMTGFGRTRSDPLRLTPGTVCQMSSVTVGHDEGSPVRCLESVSSSIGRASASKAAGCRFIPTWRAITQKGTPPMRIDSQAPGFVAPWHCFHVPSATMLKAVRWVDDEILAYATVNYDATRTAGYTITDVHRVKRMLILVDSKTILIDPLEDVDSAPQSAPARLETQ